MSAFDFLGTSIEYLKGVGPQRAEILRRELNISTFHDLLDCFPFRYVDKSNYVSIRDVSNDTTYVLLKGIIIKTETIGKGAKSRFVAVLADETGEMELVWFKGLKWIKEAIHIGKVYVVFGKPSFFKNSFNIAHPEIEPFVEESQVKKESLFPMYTTTETMKNRSINSKTLSKLVANLLQQAAQAIPETLPAYIVSKFNLINREEAYKQIHFPENQVKLMQAQTRLKFEELFFLQFRILKDKALAHKNRGLVFEHVGEVFNKFYKENLPFVLTNAQQRVIKEIRADLGSGIQMNRLLQGDVGSGKTLVALMSMLIAVDNGYQSCMMAPTEILATQHFKSITKFLKGIDVEVALLTGSTKPKERKIIDEKLKTVDIKILIGTHALIENTVIFNNLGLVVVDEQHRFGVEQRSRLWSKGTVFPHILVMTATPIPRTLAMTFYGDLDNSIIDELPPGRKPIKTVHRTDAARRSIWNFMKEEIAKGRQVYIIYPLIHESEKLDLKDLMEGFETISTVFPIPQYQISIVHGKMKNDIKDYEMQRFIRNETQIMVSTTVIEVGVDVPNASVMVIENAERFGLSQLHQLRGRVGRGAEQSFCILMTKDRLSSDAMQRIQTMVRTNDGFEIAEVDLKLRGPGDIQGTQQSGVLDLKIADIVKDEKMTIMIRDFVVKLLQDDPNLEKSENVQLKQYINENKHKFFWSKIS